MVSLVFQSKQVCGTGLAGMGFETNQRNHLLLTSYTSYTRAGAQFPAGFDYLAGSTTIVG